VCHGIHGVWSHPWTIAAAVALATDVSGLLAAEEIARAWTRRERIVWRVAPVEEVRFWIQCWRSDEDGVWLYQQAYRNVIAHNPKLSESADNRRDRMIGDLGYALDPEILDAGERHADALLDTGYALGAVTPDAVVLLCPEVAP
jgi:hypothetical protein